MKIGNILIDDENGYVYDIEDCRKYEKLIKENKLLHSIIKEVREYINKIPTQPVIRVFKKELLEILDKLNKEE